MQKDNTRSFWIYCLAAICVAAIFFGIVLYTQQPQKISQGRNYIVDTPVSAVWLDKKSTKNNRDVLQLRANDQDVFILNVTLYTSSSYRAIVDWMSLDLPRDVAARDAELDKYRNMTASEWLINSNEVAGRYAQGERRRFNMLASTFWAQKVYVYAASVDDNSDVIAAPRSKNAEIKEYENTNNSLFRPMRSEMDELIRSIILIKINMTNDRVVYLYPDEIQIIDEY